MELPLFYLCVCVKYLPLVPCTFFFTFVCLLPLLLFLFLDLFSFCSSSNFYTMHQCHTPQPSLPCLCCHPQRYIRMVQNLIERCLILRMSQDQCVKALAEHAKITPLVTLTVWRELQKENKDFFRAYFQVISPPPRPFTTSRHFHRGPRLAGIKRWK